MKLYQVLVPVLLSIIANVNGQCELPGTWKDDKGSTMNIHTVSHYRVITGDYQAAASLLNPNPPKLPFTGYSSGNTFMGVMDLGKDEPDQTADVTIRASRYKQTITL
ncbi:Hypothetical predicted protein [Pelobates cultripes]|uniref:Uncharacterized protein n=1 Tax=Pelobates cultripes TaxID=61616 RepID=A0AAD1SBT0_PELCU|nr:Hypothetical predicted protein [Pelobates cultripes]